MTVAQLERTMPLAEYHQWRAFIVYEAAMRDMKGGSSG